MTLKPSSLGSTSANYLGKSQYPDPAFLGSIDDFRIYGSAVSAANIAAMYAAGSATATSAPTGVAATAISGYRASVSWTDNAGIETGYFVERAANASFTTGLTSVTLPANSTNYIDTTVSPTTTYYYRVTTMLPAGITSTPVIASPVTTPANTAPTVTTPAAATSNPVTTTTVALSVTADDDAPEANLTYTWAALGTPPAPVPYNINGTNTAKNVTATFAKAGTYDLQVTITDGGGLSTSSAVTVTVDQTLTSITVSPLSAALATGQTQAFTATALDQFGEPLAAQPAMTWSLDAPSVGTIDSSGLYAAPTSNIGSATVRATSAATSGSATVAVSWLKGDLDSDGALGVPDITGLMSALADLPNYQTIRSLTSDDVMAIADIDGDQPVTNLDLQSLIVLLANAAPTGGGAAAALQPQAPSPGPVIAEPTLSTTSGLVTPVELPAPSNTVAAKLPIPAEATILSPTKRHRSSSNHLVDSRSQTPITMACEHFFQTFGQKRHSKHPEVDHFRSVKDLALDLNASA
jgi:hypothetical protein